MSERMFRSRIPPVHERDAGHVTGNTEIPSKVGERRPLRDIKTGRVAIVIVREKSAQRREEPNFDSHLVLAWPSR